MEDFIEALGQGVYAIDTGFQRPRFDAAYLLVEDGRAAFIDTGTNHAVPRLLAALDALQLPRSAVDWVIPTHVHLDHAGGAGLLMQSLPEARLLVHPRGLRHMLDPSALYQGAMALYGEAEMQRSYGQLQAIPASRAQASTDSMTVMLADRPLLLIDTPGHARHHHCIWDARSRGWFSGDTFGLSYGEFKGENGALIMPISTPTQFDPAALHASVRRMLSFAPQAMYLTHYGQVDRPEELAISLLEQVDQMVALGLQLRQSEDRLNRLKQGLQQLTLQRVQAHGCTLPVERQLELLTFDIELNAIGLGIWLDGLDAPKA
jgi:glyoxylase-like metal-dependent hydrolase (beta-lactamase superfamily II)